MDWHAGGDTAAPMVAQVVIVKNKGMERNMALFQNQYNLRIVYGSCFCTHDN